MILILPEVLSAAACLEIRSDLALAAFRDGVETAGWHARLVKTNRQGDPADPRVQAVKARIQGAVLAHEVFRLAARPHRPGPLLISRSGPGQGYGQHVDDAIMGGVRCDLSFTLFLTDPSEYGGGALVMSESDGEHEWRLPAGSLILYPSTTLHRVEPVTQGERLVAAGWVQSQIRSPEQRRILFDLDTARVMLFRREGKTAEFDLLSKCSANLLRAWAEV